MKSHHGAAATKSPVNSSRQPSRQATADSLLQYAEKIVREEGYGAASHSACDSHRGGGLLHHSPRNMSADKLEEQELRARELKAEVADTYAVCSALLTGFCVCTIFIDHATIEHERKSDPVRYYALIVHQVLVRLCTALALFSTLIFMLSSMYLKTSLARSTFRFETYDYFIAQTTSARKTAFWSMYYCCVIYMMSIGCAFFYSLPDKAAISVSIVVLVLLALMIWHAQHMVDTAGIIFMSDQVLQEKFRKDTCRSDAGSKASPRADDPHDLDNPTPRDSPQVPASTPTLP